jgi:hypothetical protein
MLRFLKVGGAILGIALFGATAWDLATYDTKAWSRDYAGLKKSMAQNYANLDWIVEHRRLDLKALDHSTADASAALIPVFKPFWPSVISRRHSATRT